MTVKMIIPEITIRTVIKPRYETNFWYKEDGTTITWDIPIIVQEIKDKINGMIDNYIEDRKENYVRAKKHIMDGNIELETAKKVFFLSDNYTKEDIKRQRALLLKAFHPDEGGKTEYAQTINEYYDLLIENLSGGSK